MQEPTQYLPENLDPHALNIVLQKLMGKDVDMLQLSGAAYHIAGFGLKATLDGDNNGVYGATEGLEDIDVIRGMIAAGEAKAALPIPWKFLIRIGLKVLEKYLDGVDG
jgi:hypothetical protein